MPLIRAGSPKVSVRDGKVFQKNSWTLAPEAKPDIYTCDRSRETKWVVFYTDLDSIKVKVKPGTVFNFVIVLNGKDSCYTQIKSALPAPSSVKTTENKHDTLHFTLTKFNAICVQAIVNRRDTVNLHFDVGSFDFRLTKEAILNKTHLLPNRAEVQSGNASANYNRLDKIQSMQLGTLLFNNPELWPTGFTSQGMDGRFGWNLFEEKVVEIDYDKNLLILHTRLPKLKKGYKKSKLEFYNSYVCMRGSFFKEAKNQQALYLLDTGSDLALVVDSAWVNAHKSLSDYPLIKTSTFKDPRGKVYENKVVKAPRFELGGFELKEVPTCLLGSQNPTGQALNFLGNDLLKRFNTVLDFSKDEVYLKPNGLFDLKYLD
ncbi:MAG: hypothetical protein IT236_18745 [Bacteroidia bacterium]|nr:hypothetical protein [Bacteroidia bacterium]